MNSRWLYRIYLNRSVLTFMHDMIVAAASLFIAVYLRVGSLTFNDKYMGLLMVGIPIFTCIAVTIYTIFGMYRGVWRYASVPDLIKIGKANVLAMLVFLPFLFFMTRLESLPRTVPIIQLLVLMMLLGGSRMVYRGLRSNRWVLDESEARTSIPVLIYGSGDEAEQFIRASRIRKIYKPVGILDDNPSRRGITIHGVKVLGGVRNLDRVLKLSRMKNSVPQKIVIADKSAMELTGKRLRHLMERAAKHGLTTVRLPRLIEIKEVDPDGVIPLQPINIEDLLGRPQIVMNRESIQEMLEGKRILVTGAGGSIGSEIVMQVAGFNPESICLVDNSEHNLYQIDMRLREETPGFAIEAILGDVRDRDRLDHIFTRFAPHVVFHAAAYKHVPMVEHNPGEGVMTNVIGTRNVALAAQKAGVAAMVQISTDKAVNPTNVMGATKKLAEMLCQSLDSHTLQSTRFMTVRFGNVLGSSGSVVPLFKRQLEKGGPLTVTHPDIERYFMTIPEAVGLVLSASAYGLGVNERGQIFVLDMGEAIKIDELARHMIRLAGLVPDRDVKISYTGLRPGEKLYEELFNEGETQIVTALPNIQAAEPEVKPLEQLVAIIDQLEQAAILHQTDQVHALLSGIVPRYTLHEKAA